MHAKQEQFNSMSAALLVLSDFLIFIFGWLLNRKFRFSREFFLARNQSIGTSQFIDIHWHAAFCTDTSHLAVAHLLDQYDAPHHHS
jgi:hypothetical protein